MYVNLKLQIWRSGVRQSRLAQDLGIDETILSRIINCYRTPSPHLREMLAKYFQVDEHWLFEMEEESRTDRRNGT
jgi:transcriptional regulator with XRE-family HTH domain